MLRLEITPADSQVFGGDRRHRRNGLATDALELPRGAKPLKITSSTAVTDLGASN